MNGKPQKAEYWKWIDPRDDIHGVLLSDMIEFYVDVADLIEYFAPESLKSASYGMRLGKLYYLEGEFPQLKDGEDLIIPPNSIVYVSMVEKINMPYYMIGRFNLKIDLIYQGIILGTGPQVDPGFTGHLSCPLHNISSNNVLIRQGEKFATIDFVKTTTFAKTMDKDRLKSMTGRSLYENEPILGYYGHHCLLFPEDKKARKDLRDYIPAGKRISSSVKFIENKTEETEKKVSAALKKATWWQVGSVIAVAALLIATFSSAMAFLRWEFNYLKELRLTIEDLRVQEIERENLSYRLDHLESEINKREAPSVITEPERSGEQGSKLSEKDTD